MIETNPNPEKIPVSNNDVNQQMAQQLLGIKIGPEQYILYEGVINQESTLKLGNAIRVAINNNSSKLNILLSSLGGSIYDGFVLATLIQNARIPIAIHATNHIDSIANVIFLSAKYRTAESHAKFFLHGASISDNNLDEKKLLEQLSSIRNHNTRIAYFISENCSLPLKKVKSIMKAGTTISAQEALKCGIVQEIKHLAIPLFANREDIVYIN